MKPPPRKRTRPSKELPESSLSSKAVLRWPRKDMNQLLTALAQQNTQEPLEPQRVSEHLPSRTPAEVKLFLEALKEKVIVFARSKEYTERREEQRPRKPLEMWIQEASALPADVQDTLSSAFTQMLTVTSIEPCAPPQPQNCTSSLLRASSGLPLTCSSTSPALGTPPSVRRPPPAPGTPPSVRRPPPALSKTTEVSFERIYHYLSSLHRPTEQRRLTPMESAIVLDLLMSLQDELLLLDSDHIRQHLSQVYLSMSSHGNCRRNRRCSKGLKRKPPQPQPPPAPAETPRPPLNPLRIPLSLMSRTTTTPPKPAKTGLKLESS